ncbi:MAG TPA: di-heme oxidoredictase family protein, partial [Planctomycetaceae bacterium]|nr:di-heme oxidoredictase family protein [Planctomycetaceae bacterium]
MGPGTAIGGSNDRLETRFGKITDGVFDPMVSKGGSLLQDHSIGVVVGYEYKPETVPAGATIVAHRRTTSLFGLGLVDAVPDVDFIALAASEALRNPETAGRVSMVSDLVHGGTAVGKFGWKAQVPSLMQFAADAYLNEMGITSRLFPNENCPNGDCNALQYNPVPGMNNDGHAIIAFNNFMTMLDAPPRGKISGDVVAGEKIFESIGCESCHVANMET